MTKARANDTTAQDNAVYGSYTQEEQIPIDKTVEPVLELPQRQTLINRIYGLRQSALSIAAQCEQIVDYLRRKS